MRLWTALAALAVAGGLSGHAQAAPAPSWGASPLAPAVATAGWDAPSASLDCAACLDVKLAPAPLAYRRAARWRSRHHRRARYGRVLRVRG